MRPARHLMLWGGLAMAACQVAAAEQPPGAAATNAPDPEAIHASLADPLFTPRLGTYSYSFHWLFKLGAQSKIRVERVGADYRMTTTASTGWFVDRVYRVRYSGVAVLDAETLAPRTVDINEAIRSTRRHTVMKYENGRVRATSQKTKKNRASPRREYEQDTKNGYVMDYFSAVLIARAIPWEAGDVRQIAVFDGKDISTATLECLGRERQKVLGETKDTWHIRVAIRQGGDDLDEDEKLLADKINLYLTADSDREIARIEASTPFGDMKVILSDFQPLAPAGLKTGPENP